MRSKAIKPSRSVQQLKPFRPVQPAMAIACVLAVALGGLLSARAIDRADASEESRGERSAVDGMSADAALRGASTSLAAIGEAVVAGLVAEDRDSLAGLLIAREDFQGRLFHALSNHPAAAQMGPALLWDMQAREGADELDRALRDHGGRSLRLLSVEVEAASRWRGVVIHRRPRLRVVDEQSGQEETLQILGSVIEHVASGSFVLLTYRIRGSS